MTDSPLMTLEDIAAMRKCSTRHARDVIIRLPGFPKEAPTSSGKYGRYRVWLRSEVLAFLTQAKEIA